MTLSRRGQPHSMDVDAPAPGGQSLGIPKLRRFF